MEVVGVVHIQSSAVVPVSGDLCDLWVSLSQGVWGVPVIADFTDAADYFGGIFFCIICDSIGKEL